MTASEMSEIPASPGRVGRWIIPALVASLLIHAAFVLFAWHFQLAVQTERVLPVQDVAPFQVQEVELPKEMTAQAAAEAQKASAPDAIRPPEEKISLEKMAGPNDGNPAAPALARSLLSEKPTVADQSSTLPASDALAAVERSTAVQRTIGREKSGTPTDTKVETAMAERVATAVRNGPEAGGKVKGFSNLDDLLAQTGPLRAETAPILMPTDLLFEYNEFDLRETAISSLQKLGTLISRNPAARFIIEGHTDSFGALDYNQRLSEMRAESVKSWLVQSMGLDASRIETRGFGSRRMLVPATGSIEEQRINRRVEIVVRAPAQPASR